MLIPMNNNFETMFYSNDEIEKLPLTILGKVVELRGKF
jgi:repressor LexA